MDDMGYVQIKLPPDLHKDLKMLAVNQDKTLKQLIIDVLAGHAKRKRK